MSKLLKLANYLHKKYASEIEEDSPISWPELKEQGINNPWEISDKNTIRILKNLETLFPKECERLTKLLKDSEYFRIFEFKTKYKFKEELSKIYTELHVLNNAMIDYMNTPEEEYE